MYVFCLYLNHSVLIVTHQAQHPQHDFNVAVVFAIQVHQSSSVVVVVVVIASRYNTNRRTAVSGASVCGGRAIGFSLRVCRGLGVARLEINLLDNCVALEMHLGTTWYGGLVYLAYNMYCSSQYCNSPSSS